MSKDSRWELSREPLTYQAIITRSLVVVKPPQPPPAFDRKSKPHNLVRPLAAELAVMVALWTLAAAIVGGRLPLLMTSFRPPALPGPRATGRGRSGSWWRRRSRCPRSWWSRGAPVAQRPRCQGASERRGAALAWHTPSSNFTPVHLGGDSGSPSVKISGRRPECGGNVEVTALRWATSPPAPRFLVTVRRAKDETGAWLGERPDRRCAELSGPRGSLEFRPGGLRDDQPGGNTAPVRGSFGQLVG